MMDISKAVIMNFTWVWAEMVKKSLYDVLLVKQNTTTYETSQRSPCQVQKLEREIQVEPEQRVKLPMAVHVFFIPDPLVDWETLI